MKHSITFIMSFIATLLTFSPFAVAYQQPKTPDAGKHCALQNNPDYVVAHQSFTASGSQVKGKIAK